MSVAHFRSYNSTIYCFYWMLLGWTGTAGLKLLSLKPNYIGWQLLHLNDTVILYNYPMTKTNLSFKLRLKKKYVP